jgi:predicted metal-dependent phosphoesterase TrpH
MRDQQSLDTTQSTTPAAREQPSPSGFSRADLHMHTTLGDGFASPRRVLEVARARGLKVIAVTDHDHMEGAKRVQDLIEREGWPVEMIWGSEVTCRADRFVCHFLGLFMKRPVKFLCHIEEAVEEIKSQGGLCVIPHPMGKLVPSLSERKIDELLHKGYPLDAIELYNPSPANASVRERVRELNKRWGLAATGGSDAHFWEHIGAAYTLFPGETAADLRAAIEGHTSRDGGQEHKPPSVPVAKIAAQLAWGQIDAPRKLIRNVFREPATAPGA